MAEDVEPQRFEIDTKEKLYAWTGDIAAWNNWGAKHLGRNFKPLDPNLPVHPILKREAAMALWQAGRDEWNRWVSRNAIADVNFDGQVLEAQKDLYGAQLIDFEKYKFPKGDVSFTHATFGEGNVSFNDTIFGDGDIGFFKAAFGKGRVSFIDATFGEGSIRFDGATFGEGDVNFINATFGEGNVSFDYATFGKGDVSFYSATFGEGNVSFEDATLGKGNVNFQYSSFEVGKVSLANCAFDGTARFTGLRKVDECELFSFEGCSFEKLFTFSHEGKMGCPVDLRRTKLAHTLVVADIQCDYMLERISAGPWFKIAADREDSQRFRRLKELAVANRNHAKALEFHAREIQTARGHDTTFLQDLGQFLYWATSDYGRSVKRPLGWLVTVCILWAGILWDLRQPVTSFPSVVRERIGEVTPDFWTALIYSASNMLSFIPTGRTARTQGEVLLFGGFVPEYIIALNGVQTVLSVILLFLFSLGLRNMFRV